MVIKKKGSIVPKRIIESFEKKAQHLVKFGCKCEVINNKVYPLEDGDVFIIPNDKHVLKKKNQKTVKGFHCKSAVVDCKKYGTTNTAYKVTMAYTGHADFQFDGVEFNVQ